MRTEESSFNAWIKRRRRILDLTQEDLSQCVGCSTTTIQKIELGERRPSKQMALRLAECLRLPGDEHEQFVSFARGEQSAGGLSLNERALSIPPQHPGSVGTPPAQSGHSNPSNLPAPLTHLLGRAESVAAACDYLRREDIRLLTLTGAPGIGKTRLSLQVAVDLLPHFRDGVFFVELAPVTDPSLVASTIATALGLTESGIQSIQNDLKRFLTSKRMLLVLDNFEQVLDAAPIVIDLLSNCPSLKVLVTSREALHVPGEQQFPLSPLDLPDLARMPDVEALPGYPAIALFLERARSADPTFPLNRQNALDVTTVCTRLDGLPLAIELVAARVTLLSMAEIAARLDKQLNLLASPARYRQSSHFQHLPARQQTMRSAIEWSYRLLEAEEQQLLSRLGVFVGGWTLEAAEAICGPDAADGIESLLQKSLLRRINDNQSVKVREYRFTMLESIREYALEGLEASGEAEELRRRHALYFLDLAERAEPHLTGEDQAEWFQCLVREHSNIVAAMSWSLARGEEDIALRFGGARSADWGT
jgi:predicted ATPase/transcriptional regulator with XRE-family HTH domain